MRGDNYGFRNWTETQKMENCMRLQNELSEFYEVWNKLFILCFDRGLRLVVENPYSKEHYMTRYWCYKPELIDTDRRERGDYYKKPTQYWFVNEKPKNNILFEVMNYNAIDCKDTIVRMKKEDYEKTGASSKKTARSMIHPDYANRFIREFLL